MAEISNTMAPVVEKVQQLVFFYAQVKVKLKLTIVLWQIILVVKLLAWLYATIRNR